MVLFQMLDILWSRQSPHVQRFEVMVALFGIMGDFVGSFPSWAKLPLGWVLSGRCDFAQYEVFYVKSFKFHSLVVVLGHFLLVLRHLVGCFVSGFIQPI